MGFSRISVAALVIASLLWGLANSGTKYALDGFGPLTLLAVELLCGTAALWIALLIRGYRPPASWRVTMILGALEPGLAYVCQTVGLSRTTASNAGLILGLESTFVVTLAAVFLHERINRALGSACVAALLGLAALEAGTSLATPHLGDAIVLFGALSAASYTIVARRASAERDPLALTAHQFLFASLLIVPVALGSWAGGAEAVPAHVAVRFWIAAVLVGTAGFALSFILYNYAIGYIEAGTAGMIINLIPAFALASAVLWLGEALTVGRVIGVALIGASVTIFSWTELRTEHPPSGIDGDDLCHPPELTSASHQA